MILDNKFMETSEEILNDLPNAPTTYEQQLMFAQILATQAIAKELNKINKWVKQISITLDSMNME